MVDHEDQGPISGLWRSEDMELRRMCIERSALEKVTRRFGQLGCVQFRDMNAQHEGGDGVEVEVSDVKHKRCFVAQVRTCESVERVLRYFDEQLGHFHVVEDAALLDPNDAPLGIEEFRGNTNYSDLPNALETLAHKLLADEKVLKEQVDKLATYESELKTARDRKIAVEWSERYASDVNSASDDGLEARLLDVQENQEMHSFSGQFIGTFNTDRLLIFKRLLHRVSKGYSHIISMPIEGDDEKSIFRIIYSSPEVQGRILKLAASLGVSIILGKTLFGADGRPDPRATGVTMLPDSQYGYEQLKEQLGAEIDDRQKVISSTKSLILDNLRVIARLHTQRRHYAVCEKALYHTLNMVLIDQGTSFANALCWIPTRKLPLVERVLADYELCSLGRDDLAITVEESPPTHFETNDFTGTFQGIVNSYGIPRYHEVNPAVFTVVTFPWLFGIMYGDIGHGCILIVVAAVLIAFQAQLKKQRLNEIVDMVFGARYLLLMMGFFAVYMGFLYNDTFSMMLGYGPTRYQWPQGWEDAKKWQDNTTSCYTGDAPIPLVCGSDCHMDQLTLVTSPNNETRCTCESELRFFYEGAKTDYVCANWEGGALNTMAPADGPTPFGFDMGWHDANNKLTYVNSFKMKNAVIIGVIQMTLGLFLSLNNYTYFKNYPKVFFGFIPEFIFLTCSFGYMCLMLCLKWVSAWPSTHVSPNILETLTNFFLSPGKYNKYNADTAASGYDYLYGGQPHFQTGLLICCLISVPFMLFPIPILASKQKKREDAEAALSGGPPSEIDMQDVVIRQLIHVIEFVLGCVSNTASYLRLWALSLAHAELSEVFWSFAIMKLMGPAKGVFGGVMMYFGWGAWFSATIGVLVIMEALSAFLHALRLHWVEFQNKFYGGDGNAFGPLSFEQVIEESEEAR